MSSQDPERRRQFEAYKDDVEKRGKSFFPHAMFHDTVMSLVVVSVIIGLAVVWHETADGTEAGILGPEYTEKADPASVSVIPRPDWYFYFLFYLLRIFEWPVTVVLATVGIPTILMMLLFAVPFIDRSTERRLSRRPVAIVAADPHRGRDGRAHLEGRDDAEFLASEAPTLAAEFQEANDLPDAALPGAELFAASGCLSCHTYAELRQLEPRRARPDRGGAEEPRHPVADRPPDQSVEQVARIADAVVRGARQPHVGGDPENLRNLAIFLEASKGPQE